MNINDFNPFMNGKFNPFMNGKMPAKMKTAKLIWKVSYITLSILLILVVGGAGVGLGIVSAFAKNEKIRTKEDYDKKLSGWSETSYAYFRPVNGKPKPIGQMITEDDRHLIKHKNEVSHYLIDALLSTEDREFYTHKGVVPKALLRAAWQQITGAKVTTGGSTLTQQLVKNAILNDRDKSLKRKALEIINALRIERFYSKDQILINYLNSVDFGRGAHGTKMVGFYAAARGIFNKDVKNLSLPEAAYLAGMVQRPYELNPFTGDIKKGTDRMKLVLHNMLVTGKINQQQYNEAIHFDVKSHLAKRSDFVKGYDKYPFIITAVEDEAVRILKDLDKNNPDAKNKSMRDYQKQVRQGGYQIYTTIDEKLYNAMNQSLNGLHFDKKRIGGKVYQEQVGAVLIDNKTGGVLAFYSGTDDFSKNENDHALVSQRQPGSSIKPLMVYGPAINEGILSKDSTIVDEDIPKADGSGTYKNANDKTYGPVSATYALEWSLNRPAIKVFRKLGIETGFDYIRKMDLNPNPKYDGEASALGGFHKGFTVEQMTGAYATLGNNGMFNKPHLIDRIVDSNGHVIYDYSKINHPVQVFTPQTTYELTQMLRKVVTDGTAKERIGSKLGPYIVAGKTGTTSNQYDLWFIGYTPNISLGVWSGYDKPTTANQFLAKDAWVRMFKAIAKANPQLVPAGLDFTNPGGSIPYQCFECDRGTPGPDGGPSNQPSTAPGAPGTQPAGPLPPQPGPVPAPGGQQPPQPPKGGPTPAPQPTPQPPTKRGGPTPGHNGQTNPGNKNGSKHP
jgi:penicillin-binding protein